MKLRNIKNAALSIFLSAVAAAQSGGNFAVTQSVVAGGGNQGAAGGAFAADNTVGQILAGTNSAGGIFSIGGGFWAVPLAPSAAQVSIGGRVLTANGLGIRNVQIILTAPNGETRTATTSTFGHYRFESVAVGETYILTVAAKKFRFAQPTIVRSIVEEIGDLDFVANPQ
jgi:hypothetical protein